MGCEASPCSAATGSCHGELPAGSWRDPGAPLGHPPHTHTAERAGYGHRHDTPPGSLPAAHAQPGPISAGQGAASTNQRWAGRSQGQSAPGRAGGVSQRALRLPGRGAVARRRRAEALLAADRDQAPAVTGAGAQAGVALPTSGLPLPV